MSARRIPLGSETERDALGAIKQIRDSAPTSNIVLLCGLGNKDIAYQLSISDSTVRHHMTNIFDNVGVPNRQKPLLHAHAAGAAE